MRALVTGGGGFLGRYLIEQLIARKIEVRVVSRKAYPELAALGCECVRGDLREFSVVKDSCNNVDTVFHVAALAGIWGRREDFFSINYEGTKNVINACLANSVSRLVYTSTPSVVFGMQDIESGDETLPYPDKYVAYYPESKAAAEQLLLEANGKNGLATCALRPHLIWGPRDPHILPMLIRKARSGKLVQVGAGKNIVDITYVENAAAAHVQAAEKLALESPLAGQAYFISDDNPVNLWVWINHLLERLNLPNVKKRISYRAAYTIGAISEVLHTLVPPLGEPNVTRFLASQFATSHYFSISKAKRDFDYHPPVAAEEALVRTIEWFSESCKIERI